jgi:hypothetical protein
MLLLALLLVAALIIAWSTRAWSSGFGRRADTVTERMSLAAKICEASARNAFHVELDHSIESLPTLDDVMKSGFASEIHDDSVYVLGAYLGDVIIREIGGRWSRLAANEKYPKLTLASGEVFDPFDIVTAKMHFPEISLEQEVRRRLEPEPPAEEAPTEDVA